MKEFMYRHIVFKNYFKKKQKYFIIGEIVKYTNKGKNLHTTKFN